MPLTPAVLARFESKIERTDGCWLWRGSIQKPNGYGVFWLDGQNRLAHRLAWEIANDRPVPPDHVIDHRCHTPECDGGPCLHRRCVRPADLEPVLQKVNVNRGRHNRDVIPCCPRGHEYDAANTYVRKNGTYKCRTCHREDEARRRSGAPSLARQRM